MNDFIKSFGTYTKEAPITSFPFWAFPIGTLLLIWLLTIAGLKIFTKRKKLKTVFMINRAWILSSLIVAAILIGLICFWWSKNYFTQHPWQLSLLLSLTIAMLIPVLSLMNLRSYYTMDGIKEITDQPKTVSQLDATISFAKKVFRSHNLYFLIPAAGFLLLLFYLNKGTNLISLVYDNSGSMTQTDAVEALSETFDNLQENNEITLTTLEGFTSPDDPAGKPSMRELMLVSKSVLLKGGNVVSFSNPLQAKTGLSQTSNPCFGSPVCESIWKTYLFVKETKPNQTYIKKLMIVITDGWDNIDSTLQSGKFFFDDESFAGHYAPENVFVINYSKEGSSALITRFESTTGNVYPASNKQAYLDALDIALQSFKNNWHLIFWTILIYLLFAIIGFLIQPKRIV